MVNELFQNNFGAWLQANGVVFTQPADDWPVKVPFEATVDLNTLKLGIQSLISCAEYKSYKKGSADLAEDVAALARGDAIVYTP